MFALGGKNLSKFSAVVDWVIALVLAWAAITKHHRLRGLTNRNSFSHSSGGEGASRVGLWRGPSLWLADGRLLAVSSRQESKPSGVSSSMDTNPIRPEPCPRDLV